MRAWPFSATAKRELRGPLVWGLGNSLERMMAQLYSMAGHDQRRPCERWRDHGVVGQAVLRGQKGHGNRTWERVSQYIPWKQWELEVMCSNPDPTTCDVTLRTLFSLSGAQFPAPKKRIQVPSLELINIGQVWSIMWTLLCCQYFHVIGAQALSSSYNANIFSSSGLWSNQFRWASLGQKLKEPLLCRVNSTVEWLMGLLFKSSCLYFLSLGYFVLSRIYPTRIRKVRSNVLQSWSNPSWYWFNLNTIATWQTLFYLWGWEWSPLVPLEPYV